MDRRNIIGLETRRGYRTVELYEGDLTSLGCQVDVLVVSAFAGGYDATPGTLQGHLRARLGLNLEKLLRKSSLDLRSSLGIWISQPISSCEFSRILCVELVGGELDIEEALRNVFVTLLLLEAKGVGVATVALPILGAGLQGLDVEYVVRTLLAAARDYFQRSNHIERVLFVEINPERVKQLDLAMNTVLGRSRVTLPKSELLKSLRDELRSSLYAATSLFDPDHRELRDDWLRVLDQSEPQSFELGVLARKLVERLVSSLLLKPRSSADLRTRIDELGNMGVATWIRGYMHVLRHLGNESAHVNPIVERFPPHVAEADLALCLLCVERLLEFWHDHESIVTRQSLAEA